MWIAQPGNFILPSANKASGYLKTIKGLEQSRPGYTLAFARTQLEVDPKPNAKINIYGNIQFSQS